MSTVFCVIVERCLLCSNGRIIPQVVRYVSRLGLSIVSIDPLGGLKKVSESRYPSSNLE
jgi:hypothetical protein